jgi:hypothetical protein
MRYYARTPEQVERQREYERIWHDAKRREWGVPPRNFHNRRTVLDGRRESLIERAPLLVELAALNGSQREVAELAGVPERTLYRLLHDGGRWVALDTADRLAIAMGVPLAVIYREDR